MMVRGTIDRIDITNDGAIITDYKVGERSDDHAWQVRTYAWAAERATGKSTAGTQVAYLRPTRVEIIDVTPDTRVDATSHTLDRALTAGTFAATPGAVCKSCAHRTACEFAA